MLLTINKCYVFLLSLLSVVIFSFCACIKLEDQNGKIEDVESDIKQMDVNNEEPLRVFYLDAGLLANFSNLYPDVKLDLYKIYEGVDNEDVDIAYWAKKYGDPDIVLLNDCSGFDIEEEYEKGQVEDIRKYCEEDFTLDESNYIAGTFEVLKTNEDLMGLPISWYKDCLIVKESELKNSELEILPENYTGRELFEALLAEINKEQYTEKFLWLDYLSFDKSLTETAPRTNGKFEIDEEMFKVLFELSVRSKINYQSAKECFEDFGAHRSQTQGEAALDPQLCPGGYFGSVLRGAPQVTAIYAKSVAAMDQDNVELYWIPTIDNGEEYVGLVRDYAFIGKNSSRKQQAYEVIRMMMDMPVTIMTQPEGSVPEIYSSVNIEKSLEMLDHFNGLTQELTIRDITGKKFYTLEQQELDDEELQRIRGMITGISNLYLDFSSKKRMEYCKSYYDYEALCIGNGKIDYKQCYAEMKKYFDVNNTTEGICEVSNGESTEKESSEVIESTSEETQEVKDLKEKIRNTEVGETIFLGETEQDNDLNNGSEPIEWIILDKTESKAFVISKKVLEYLTFSEWKSMSGVDGVMYMEPKNYFTWKIERNQQRVWLLNELYENGFTESEKVIILQTHNESPSWRDLDSEEGSDDYLYIPSKEDIEQYMPDVQQRQAEMTEYVAEKAATTVEKYGTWSLRTEGATPKYSMQILENGEFSSMYCSVANGVRPCMWLDIS